MSEQFTWIDIYQELADALKDWEPRQQELIAILQDLRAKGRPVTPLMDQDEAGNRFPLEEIDPFTFYGAFNRGLADKSRQAILTDLKEIFGLRSPVPRDFAGIPVLFNTSSWFFAWKHERTPEDVPRLWRVFRLALGENPVEDEEFWRAFDDALQVKRVNINLTMGLFWIRPYTFLSLDKVNRDYLGIELPKEGLSATFYRRLLADMASRDESFPELSLAAWRKANNGGGNGKPPPVDNEGKGQREGVNPLYTLDQMAEETGFELATLERWVRAIHRKGQAIFYGPPGTGKTFVAEQLAKHLVGGGDGFVELVQFHPAYAYEDFIQGIRPESDGDRLRYPLKPGRFLDFIAQAGERSGTSVLIIDEINRANLARVFGELMYLLEYRDRQIPLAGGGYLRIPDNVRILGTMNTADRSIALVDHALRRRFAFLALWPDMDILRHYHQRRETGFPLDGLITVLHQLNDAIGDRHYQVGVTFFLRTDLGKQIEDIWRMEIEPYLEEYFFDQPEKVESFRWERVGPIVLPNG